MKRLLLSVHDSKAKVFFNPFTATTVEAACRSFAVAANDDGTEISRYPADFTLFHVGYFDDETGVVESLIPAVNLGNASMYAKGGIRAS